MIACSDLHDGQHYINPDLVERIESTPDTQLVFVNGHRFFVKETPEEIVDRIKSFRRECGARAAFIVPGPAMQGFDDSAESEE